MNELLVLLEGLNDSPPTPLPVIADRLLDDGRVEMAGAFRWLELLRREPARRGTRWRWLTSQETEADFVAAALSGHPAQACNIPAALYDEMKRASRRLFIGHPILDGGLAASSRGDAFILAAIAIMRMISRRELMSAADLQQALAVHQG